MAGNFIGVDVARTAALKNAGSGVRIVAGASHNLVGTDGDEEFDEAERNVISGNGNYGVSIVSTSAGPTVANVLAGNYIGVDHTGMNKVPNAYSGVEINGASGNRIGTNGDGFADESERNIISGNRGQGVGIWTGAEGNVVAGNYIGVAADGTSSLGNGQNGVSIKSGSRSNCIGTDGSDDPYNANERNVISGNTANGVNLTALGTDGNLVAGNYIGTDASGTNVLPNSEQGVSLNGGAQSNWIGTDGDGVGDEVEGNVISGNKSGGVLITGSGSDFNVVAGNYVGTDVTGTVKLGNGIGLFILSGAKSNRIGSDGDGTGDQAERNLISGNQQLGVLIGFPGSDANMVSGNYIGTDVTGSLPLGNGAGGVGITGGGYENGPQGNYVGINGANSASPGMGNVISGNTGSAVTINQSSGNFVSGNYIGVDATGIEPLGNTHYGVILGASAQSNVVGTDGDGHCDAAEGNVISANGAAGIFVADASSSQNVVAGNYIGSDATGSIALGNQLGIWIAGAHGNRVGTNGDGTSDEAERNVIAFNVDAGVVVSGETATSNRIQANAIYANGALGVELGWDGVTENDGGDADIGANQLQNHPLLGLVEAGTTTRVAGTLNSSTNTTFTLDFYANSAVDPSGHGEGARYLGSTTVTTDTNGHASFEVFLASATQSSEWVTATATDPDGNTSEFSGAMLADASASTLVVTNTNNSGVGSLRQAMLDANAKPGPNTIAFSIPATDPSHVYYRDDGMDGSLSLVAATTADDDEITDFDPDYPGTPFSWYRIQPTSSLFRLMEATMIDGYSQPGAQPNTQDVGSDAVVRIELDGTLAGWAAGVWLNGGASLVRGLAINNFQAHGVLVTGPEGNTIAGNFIGTDVTGTKALGNGLPGSSAGGVGIFLSGSHVVGTDGDGVADAAERNVIAGNQNGVLIWADPAVSSTLPPDAIGTDTDFNVVAGNYIGTDATGSKAVGNTEYGVWINFGARGNRIGTDFDGTGDVAERNIISGNKGYGVAIKRGEDGNNVVAGNYMGINATGTAALPNDGGVRIYEGAKSNRVERNVLSGNRKNGVLILDAGTELNSITGNYIGTDASGTSAIPNELGIIIGTGAERNWIGTNGDGLADETEGNVISGNTTHGVFITQPGTDHNVIAGNFIGTDVTGAVALGNTSHGVLIQADASSNRIGTNGDGIADDAEGNVVSANGVHGVAIAHAGTNDNVVAGNYIGTDATGTAALGNAAGGTGGSGVFIANGARRNRVGTDGSADDYNEHERNVISGNESYGVQIKGTGTIENVVAGNYVGTDATGGAVLGNVFDAVHIAPGADANRIGTDGDGQADGSERTPMGHPTTLNAM